ncbi:L,D-transpeptidase family protein [Bermanella sp. R86510]|uniref:L,D-transpeptidase family protein n=1 Tax=unclassified Bermanella TaxID=2627862 RepID=UPI0037CADEB8
MRKLVIFVARQILVAYENDTEVKSYPISTALNGTGQKNGSGQTPLGEHYIRAKIGGDQALNSVFIGRRPTGEIYTSELAQQFPKRDWILSRILWLCGTQVGYNRLGSVDTMSRYIYIHGTPDIEPMGVAKSHGCIRMRNLDVIDLFDWVPVGCPVLIQE